MRNLSVFLLSVLLIVSCGDQSSKDTPHRLYLFGDDGSEISSVSFAASGGSQKIKLMADDSWEVRDIPQWLSVTPPSGVAGAAILMLTASENSDSDSRQAKVSIAAGSLSKSLTVTQISGDSTGTESPDYPVADLLDVAFHSDGTAYDRSANKLEVTTVEGFPLVNFYSPKFSRYSSHFGHTAGAGVSEGYYRVDYSSNRKMLDGLADGHSLEVVFRTDVRSDGSKEIKMFSSMQQGGTGFLISKASNGTQLTFLPNVSSSASSKWNWTGSGINPEPGRYYHAVGVWDKENNESRIYVDGVLKGTVKTAGNYIPPTSSCLWFGIGVDAGTSGGDSAWNGEVAIARIYDKPLNASQVKALYEAVDEEQESDPVILSDVAYLPECELKDGYKYHIFASGFKASDVIRFESVSSSADTYECATTISTGSAAATVPSGLKSGKYRVMVKRGDSAYPVGAANVTITDNPTLAGDTKIIAHRGYHTGGHPENSRAAFKAAMDLGVYGSEFDTWITTDGVVVVNHNSTFPTDAAGHVIQNSLFEDLKDIRLSNGETVPTLEDILESGRQGSMKLVLEIKTHADRASNNRVVDACIEKVKGAGLEGQVMWIAFDYENCKRIHSALPDAQVQYLGGNMAPSVVAADGLGGIDYSMANFTSHPTWIAEAKSLNLKVNVWTVNSTSAMSTYISKGVDFLTTDYPIEATGLLSRKFVTKE